jgi:hypothetical protein
MGGPSLCLGFIHTGCKGLGSGCSFPDLIIRIYIEKCPKHLGHLILKKFGATFLSLVVFIVDLQVKNVIKTGIR